MTRISGDTKSEADERGLISPAEVLRRLKKKGIDCSRRTLGRMVRARELDTFEIDGIRFFNPDDIEALAPEDMTVREDKDFVLDWSLETMEKQFASIGKLISLAHDPAQETIKALLTENKSLRDRNQVYESKVTELHETYGLMIIEMGKAEAEAAKEANKLKMQSDAFEMLKTRLVPMLMDHMGSKNFQDTFTDEQLEAFLESGIGTPQQVAAIKKVLASRKGTKSNGKAHDGKPVEDTRSNPSERRPGGGPGETGAGSTGGS